MRLLLRWCVWNAVSECIFCHSFGLPGPPTFYQLLCWRHTLIRGSACHSEYRLICLIFFLKFFSVVIKPSSIYEMKTTNAHNVLNYLHVLSLVGVVVYDFMHFLRILWIHTPHTLPFAHEKEHWVPSCDANAAVHVKIADSGHWWVVVFKDTERSLHSIP